MKRLLLILGVLGMVLVLSCSWLDWHNDIEYPAEFFMLHETPGDPITFSFAFRFQDQTLDTSGVELKWEKRGSDTLWFSLKGTDGDIDYKGSYRTQIEVNVGVLENGNYTLLFEGEGRDKDTFTFTVEDSLYSLLGDDGTVAGLLGYDTLRRIFPNMLYVYLAGLPGVYDPTPYLDSITVALEAIGANVAHVANGRYSLGPWDWNDAVANGWIGEPDGRFYTFDGDTMELDSVYKVYIKKDWLGALGVRMGNGFYRLYEPWNE